LIDLGYLLDQIVGLCIPLVFVDYPAPSASNTDLWIFPLDIHLSHRPIPPIADAASVDSFPH
jgi:hypothetical protein